MSALPESVRTEARIDALRVPPQSAEAEQAVIGGLMLDPSKLQSVVDLISEDDFYRRDHRLIFRAITELASEAKPFDAVTLGEWFESNGLSEQIGRAGYIIELASSTPSASNIEAYAGIVREKAVLRQLIEAGTDIVNAGFDGEAMDAYAVALSKVSAIQPRLNYKALPPVDLFDEQRTPDVRPEWLPPHLSEFVFECSAVKGSPPEVLAMAALVSCSAACHDGFKVQPKSNEPGWRESARLWGMIVGDPSAKKTPPMKLAMGPLTDLNFQFVADYGAERQRYDEAMKLYTAEDKRRVAAVAKGEGEPEAKPKPDEPKQRRIIVNDATIEKLSDLLSHNERGMLYFNDELAGWFASMDTYAKGATAGRDRSYWLKFYEGGRHIIDRMSRPPTVVDNASMRILGAIQPDRIRSMAQKMDDDGLLQRFMVTVIPTGIRQPVDRPEPVHLINKYKAILTQLWNTHPGEATGAVQMSPEALIEQRELAEFVESLIVADGLPTMLRSHLAKWSGLFPRLCLTYHMIGCAAAHIYPTSVPVAGATAKRVSLLMRKWLLPNAMAFYTGLIGQASPVFDLAKQIGDYLLAHNVTRCNNRDLTLNVMGWRSAPEWKQKGAVSILEQAGWLLPSGIVGTQRKPSWPVNPRVHVEFAARGEAVRVHRSKVAAVLAAMRAEKSPTSFPSVSAPAPAVEHGVEHGAAGGASAVA